MPDSALASPARTRQLVGGLSMDTLRRRAKAGLFPEPVVLARDRHGRALRIAWVEAEVLKWCADRIAEHRGLTATDLKA